MVDHELPSSEPDYFRRRSEPRASVPPSRAVEFSLGSPPIDAEVLWFNAEKGFGFAKLSDGSDAFLHMCKLQVGVQSGLAAGTKLQVRIEVGPKGPQVSEVVSVGAGDDGCVSSHAPNQLNVRQPQEAAPGEQESLGSVKRYDTVKGFGFIALEHGGKDVFVHATILTRSGLTTLDVGQAVTVKYSQGHKALEARSIQLAQLANVRR